MPFEISPPSFHFNPRVILGFCDISDSGARITLALSSSSSSSSASHPILKDNEPLLKHPQQNDLPLVQVSNSADGKFTYVSLNTHVAIEKAAELMNDLVDLLVAQKVTHITILAAMDLAATKAEESQIHSISLPPQKGNVAVPDPVLASLLNLLLVEKLPTRALLVHGKKPTGSKDDEGTQRSLKLLLSALKDEHQLDLDLKEVLAWKLSNPRARRLNAHEDMLYR